MRVWTWQMTRRTTLRLYWRPGVPWGVYHVTWGPEEITSVNLPLVSIEWSHA